MLTQHELKTWQSEPKTNSDLPNWISWDKTQGKYCLLFENDRIPKEKLN
jgi:hypothetical protein